MTMDGAKLKEQAVKCRRLAKDIDDRAAHLALLELATDLDKRAETVQLKMPAAR